MLLWTDRWLAQANVVTLAPFYGRCDRLRAEGRCNNVLHIADHQPVPCELPPIRCVATLVVAKSKRSDVSIAPLRLPPFDRMLLPFRSSPRPVKSVRPNNYAVHLLL